MALCTSMVSWPKEWVAEVRMNRPEKRNAMNQAFWRLGWSVCECVCVCVCVFVCAHAFPNQYYYNFHCVHWKLLDCFFQCFLFP